MDFSNIPTGLKITSQIPLNVKEFCKDEDTLAYLGVDDNLAFTYYDQLEVLCLAEKSIYIWREVQTGEENTGLVPLDFTYPLDLPETYGINYSGKKYNFFLKQILTFEEFNNLVIIKNVGNEIGIYKDSTINNNQIEFNFKTLTSNDNSVLLTELANTINLQSKIYIEQGSNITITGDGTELNPFIINSGGGGSTTEFQDGYDTQINGQGILADPFSVDTKNLQKFIPNSLLPYTLVDSDDKYTLFVEANGENSIIIPPTLKDNFICAIRQTGVGYLTILADTGGFLLFPSSFVSTVAYQYGCVIVEKELSTTNYHLTGDLKQLI